jgi:transcriptional regulator
MYVPDHFSESELAWLHGLMRRHPFASLVSARPGEAPFATHLPLLLDAGRGELGTLVGHVARANPHWRAFDGRTQTLAIFSGPHAYVSARWYPSTRRVPTWNYLAVHASGRPRILDDPSRVISSLRSLMSENDASLSEAAAAFGAGARELADIPFPHLEKLLRRLVAFELPIERLEGKRKLSQNTSVKERRALIAGLRAAGREQANAIAHAIEGTLAVESEA